MPSLTAEEPWHPWGALREREHIVFALEHLPAGMEGIYCPRGDRAVILIHRDLLYPERRAALAHELIHDERRGGCDFPDAPPLWWAEVAKEEAIVDKEVARRLVPRNALHRFCARMVDLGYGVTAEDVAEEFEVPPAVAARALALWWGRN